MDLNKISYKNNIRNFRDINIILLRTQLITKTLYKDKDKEEEYYTYILIFCLIIKFYKFVQESTKPINNEYYVIETYFLKKIINDYIKDAEFKNKFFELNFQLGKISASEFGSHLVEQLDKLKKEGVV